MSSLVFRGDVLMCLVRVLGLHTFVLSPGGRRSPSIWRGLAPHHDFALLDKLYGASGNAGYDFTSFEQHMCNRAHKFSSRLPRPNLGPSRRPSGVGYCCHDRFNECFIDFLYQYFGPEKVDLTLSTFEYTVNVIFFFDY